MLSFEVHKGPEKCSAAGFQERSSLHVAMSPLSSINLNQFEVKLNVEPKQLFFFLLYKSFQT